MLLLVPHISATWSTPVKFMENSGAGGQIQVLSVYRDPASSVNHVFVFVGGFNKNYYHMAVKDDGTVLHKTEFDLNGEDVARIRGTGDGRGLFLVYSSGKTRIMFSESTDGGANWSEAVNIVEDADSDYKLLGDMLRVDSGRLYVMFVYHVKFNEAHIKMVTRSPGSSVFSKETVIATDADHDYNYYGPSAAYGYRGGKLYLHVVYLRPLTKNYKIAYTYSDNNGVSWSKRRELDGTTETLNINYLKSVDEHLYLSYTLRPSRNNLLQLVRSSDFGATFGPPQTFYVSKSMELVTCSARNYKKLASLRSTRDPNFEYATWDPATLKSGDASNITFPIDGYSVGTAIDCEVYVKKGLRKVVAFISTRGSISQISISVDTAAID